MSKLEQINEWKEIGILLTQSQSVIGEDREKYRIMIEKRAREYSVKYNIRYSLHVFPGLEY